MQTMVWVDRPPNGLVAEYYPVATEPAARCPERIGDSSGNGGARRPAQNAVPIHDSGSVTELNKTAAIDLVSSAARGLTIGKEVVRYVNAVEESCAVGAVVGQRQMTDHQRLHQGPGSQMWVQDLGLRIRGPATALNQKRRFDCSHRQHPEGRRRRLWHHWWPAHRHDRSYGTRATNPWKHQRSQRRRFGRSGQRFLGPHDTYA